MKTRVQLEKVKTGQEVQVYRQGFGFVKAVVRLILENGSLIQVQHQDGSRTIHAYTA